MSAAAWSWSLSEAPPKPYPSLLTPLRLDHSGGLRHCVTPHLVGPRRLLKEWPLGSATARPRPSYTLHAPPGAGRTLGAGLCPPLLMLSYPLLSGGERLGSSDRHERSRGGSVRPCQGPIALALPTSRQGQSEQAERDHPQSRRLAAGPRLRQDLRGAAVQPLQPGGRAHAACCTSRQIGSATAHFTRAFRG